MDDRSPLRRFAAAYRDFGLAVTLRVATARLRGRLMPARALPPPPTYGAAQRAASVLLCTDAHDAATLEAAVAAAGAAGWEVCICERPPVAEATARLLARLRGAHPWLRVVTAEADVDAAMARQWTVEQASGGCVVLVAPGCAPDAAAFDRLLARQAEAAPGGAVGLFGRDGDCRLLLRRKADFLAGLPGGGALTAPAQAGALAAAGVPVAVAPAGDAEVLA